jgi:hypothetical protein
MFQILPHQNSCLDVNPEASVIVTNAQTKRDLSALDYIQILYHEDSSNGIGTSVIRTRTLITMKLHDYLPHTELGHVFPSLLPPNIHIPIF